MRLKIRTGSAVDLPAILAITAASPTAPQWQVSDFEAILAAGADLPLRRTLLVAEADGAVAGFAVYTALVSVFPPEAELESLAVDPARRRRGVGAGLLQAVRERLEALGAETLLLEVRAGNVGAIKLYASAGFKESGIRRGYYSNPGEDAVCMQLTLAQSITSTSNE